MNSPKKKKGKGSGLEKNSSLLLPMNVCSPSSSQQSPIPSCRSTVCTQKFIKGNSLYHSLSAIDQGPAQQVAKHRISYDQQPGPAGRAQCSRAASPQDPSHSPRAAQGHTPISSTHPARGVLQTLRASVPMAWLPRASLLLRWQLYN